MMVIKHLRSEVDLERNRSLHSMVVGVSGGDDVEVEIGALTYGQLAGLFDQTSGGRDAGKFSLEPAAGSYDPADAVASQVSAHLGHQLAPVPPSLEEAAAEEQLRSLELRGSSSQDDARALLDSVGFFADSSVGDDLDVLASGVPDDPDPGEQTPFDDDDGVEAF